MAFIYKITNKLNNKSYIGKTENSVEKRYKQHLSEFKKDRCRNRPLYRAMIKYGVENFDLETLEETENPSEREVFWISYYSSFQKGYNATRGGDGSTYVDRNLLTVLHEKELTVSEISFLTGHDEGHILKLLRKCVPEYTHVLPKNSRKGKDLPRGVRLNPYKKGKKYVASVNYKKVFYSLGSFDSVEEASLAYFLKREQLRKSETIAQP